MATSFRLALRLILLAAPITPGPSSPISQELPAPQAIAARPEVRIRKLHLVRPDLINYPLAYEVVC